MPAKVNEYGEEYGACGVGLIRIASDVADEETVTVGAEVYEFDRAADGVTSGRIAVTTHADDTPAEATTALTTAINANNTGGLRAVRLSANAVMLVSKGPATGTVVALAETMAGTNNTVESAVDGGSFGSRGCGVARVPSAVEVGVGLLAIPLAFTPVAVHVQVRVTSTGVVKAWDGAMTLVAKSGATPGYVLLDNSGSTDWAATDTVYVIAFE